MFNFMGNGMFGIPQNLQTPVTIPNAVAQPHSATPIGYHPMAAQNTMPIGPQGQHFNTPQGAAFAQQRQQQIAAAQAQEQARQQALAEALRQRQIEQEQMAQQSNEGGPLAMSA